MTKERIIERLCALATEVGKAHNSTLAHDCFCGHPDSLVAPDQDFRFEVIDFIEEAVREKIARMTP